MNTFRRPILRALCSVALLIPCLAPLDLEAAIPGPEKLLPDDTLVMVTIPDFARAREIYNTSPQTGFWKDPSMKPFRDKFVEKLKDELVEPLERELGIKLNDYANLFDGQLTIAFTQNGWLTPGSEASPGLLLLLDARDKSPQLTTNLADLRRKWIDTGRTLKTERIRDIEFSILAISKNDLPGSVQKLFSSGDAEDEEGEDSNATRTELVIGQHESLLVIGTSIKPVEKVAVRLSGGAMPTVGDLAAYETVDTAMFRDAPLYGWANLKSFVDLLTARSAAGGEEADENPFAMFEPEKIIMALGLKGLQTLGFNVRNSGDGTSAEFAIGVPESSRQGIFKLFPSGAKESGPPPFVPADAAKFQRWRIDGQQAWATLQGILNDISPQIVQTLNFMLDTANTAAQEKDPDFDIRKNIFGNLGDDMVSYEKAPKGDSLIELGSPPSLMLIGSPRPEPLAAALKNLFVLFNQQAGAPVEREFLGRKIYSVPVPALVAMAAESGSPSSLHYAASGSYVAISTDVPMLEEYLRNTDGQQKSLRDTPGLTAAIEKVGGSSTGFFGFENQVETTRPILEMLRKSSDEDQETPMLAPGIPMFTPESAFDEWLDFSLLPPFEQIAKYFHFTVYSGSANVDGISLKVFSPVPPELRK